jgi:hypothetical protein
MRCAALPARLNDVSRSGGEASKDRDVGQSYVEAFASRSASRSLFSEVFFLLPEAAEQGHDISTPDQNV